MNEFKVGNYIYYPDMYEKYKQFSIWVHSVMNSVVNKICYTSTIEFDTFPFISESFAETVFPNRIIVYLGYVLQNCIESGFDHDQICSFIIMVIVHELSHIDQFINLKKYGDDKFYNEKIENDNIKRTAQFIAENGDFMESIFGINLYTIDNYTPKGFKRNRYRSCDSIQKYYIMTIDNLIMSNDINEKRNLNNIFNKYKSISISFNGGPIFRIKLDGRYLPESVPLFVDNINKFCNLFYIFDAEINVYSYDDKNEDNIILCFEITNINKIPIRYNSEMTPPDTL